MNYNKIIYNRRKNLKMIEWIISIPTYIIGILWILELLSGQAGPLIILGFPFFIFLCMIIICYVLDSKICMLFIFLMLILF